MNKATIDERVHAAIRPALLRADRAIWELQNPRTIPGKHTAGHLIGISGSIGAGLLISDSITIQRVINGWYIHEHETRNAYTEVL